MAFLTQAANRGSISTGPYEIDNSLKLESNNTERVNKAAGTISGAGNRRTFTISFWTKRTEINGVKQYLFEAGNSDSNTDRFTLRFGTGDTFDIQSQNTWLVTNRKFRDTAAWYHFVIKVDTTDGTAANRIKLYVNGVEETSFSTDNRGSINQNHDFPVNNTEDHIIGNSQIEGSLYYNGYIAEWIQLDGTAAAPTSFGEFDEDSGIWIPKDPSALSFGTNGFWLDFEDSSTLGNDKSGGTDFTLTNVAAADQATDTPTNNFCTWNPLWAFYRNSTITEGGTEVAGAGGGWSHAGATMGVTNGRWYWEWKITSSDIGFISFSTLSGNLNLNQLGHDNSVIMGYGAGNIYTWLNGSQGSTENTGWGTWAVNDIIGIFLDVENSDRRFTLYKNGSAISGNVSFPVSFPNAMQTANGGGNIFPYNVQYENDGGEWNFGGYTTMSNSKSYSDDDGHGSFVYNPVLGSVNYYAICTKNLAEYGG